MTKYSQRLIEFYTKNGRKPVFIEKSFEITPDTPIDKISVTAYHNVVEMYNGEIDISFYPDMTHPLLKPRKVRYGSENTIFDGQLFIRTLTPIEYNAYRKTMKNKAK